MRLFCIAFALLAVAAACKKKVESVAPYTGYEYFPVRLGQQLVYRIDSITYDGFTGRTDSVSYELMERIDTLIQDLESRPTYVVGRYVRPLRTTPWKLTGYYRANRFATTAERLESNVRYVKLAFPVVANRSWQGNQFNTDVPREFRYTAVHQPRSFGRLAFDSTASVLQIDETLEGFFKNYAAEVYATGVGMVSKTEEVLDYQGDHPAGYKLTYTLTSHN